MVLEEILFVEFQVGHSGGHLGYWNGTILEILNFCITVMPPIKFWLSQTYSFGGDVVLRSSSWRPSWISELNDFSNLNFFVTVMPPIKFQLKRTYILGGDGSHLGYQNETISAILNVHVATMPPTKFQLNSTYGSGGDVENVKS